MAEILTADNLSDIAGLRHGFFTRGWGSCGQSPKFDRGEQERNRAQVALKLGVPPSHLLSCYQIHSPHVVTVTEVWPIEKKPEADAMVTNVKGIALGILTADCGPLLFADPGVGVIGAAHSGWRGTLTGVIENTIAAMEKLGANRKAIRAALGPCIGPRSYEVGPEFPAPFLADNPVCEKFFRPAFKSDHYMFDLPGVIEAKLREAGLISISPSPADTLADEERFFSYRRDTLRGISPTPSLISAVALAA